jgi:hypothetical protein
MKGNSMTIDELKALERKATPGPWDNPEWDAVERFYDVCAGIGSEQHQVFVTQDICSKNAGENARFIVSIRNLVPEFLALWEACNEPAPRADRGAEWMERIVHARNDLNFKAANMDA